MAIAKFYLGDPRAPKPNRPARLGVNILVQQGGRLLMEYRQDCDFWSLIGGGVHGAEPEAGAAVRELREETGIQIRRQQLVRLRAFQEPDRISAYRNGEVRRMVCILYRLELEKEPVLRISRESRKLEFFTPEQLRRIPIAPTHLPMVELFCGAEG